MFGGRTLDNPPTLLNLTHSLDYSGRRWDEVATPNSTMRPIWLDGMVYDSGGGEVVLFGGMDASNVIRAETWFFTSKDFTRPRVAWTLPADRDVNVTMATNISIAFTEPMNRSTVQAAFSIVPAAAGVFSWTGSVFTFDPSGLLINNTLYTVKVAAPAADLAGNTMGTDYSFSFTTEGAERPWVVLTKPGDGQTGVPADANVLIRFSKLMNQTSAESAYTISPPTTGAFRWSAAEMTFDPVGNLSFSTNYTVSVDTRAKDLAGRPLSSNYTFRFTVMDRPPGPVPPRVLSVEPKPGTLNVSVATKVKVVFSAPMERPSAEAAFRLSPATTGGITWQGETLVFAPSSNLSFETVYSVFVSRAAKDLNGSALEQEFLSSFTTHSKDYVPPQPPAVIFTQPYDTEVNVSAALPVVISFSEKMNRSSAESAVSFEPLVNGTSFVWDREGTVMTVPHSEAFRASRVYIVTISKAATSLAGVGMEEEYKFIFTTAPAGPAPDRGTILDSLGQYIWYLALVIVALIGAIAFLLERGRRQRAELEMKKRDAEDRAKEAEKEVTKMKRKKRSARAVSADGPDRGTDDAIGAAPTENPLGTVPGGPFSGREE